MQAPTSNNTIASSTTAPSDNDEFLLGVAQDPAVGFYSSISSSHSERYTPDTSKDSKESVHTSSPKHTSPTKKKVSSEYAIDKKVYPIYFVKHEDFPKLRALQINLDRWEKDILRYTGCRWQTQQGDELPISPLNTKLAIIDLQACLEYQRETANKFQVLRRGKYPAADKVIDRAIKILCQECLDIFRYMSVDLIEEPPRHYEKDLNVLCRALSPIDEWELERTNTLQLFSEYWLSEDESFSGEQRVDMDGFLPFYPLEKQTTTTTVTKTNPSYRGAQSASF